MKPSIDPARDLETFIRDSIPMARTIDVRVRRWDGDTLVMAAPLAPNVNDKGCAFGGSLASVMTLAGWSLVELVLRQRDLDCDVFVADSTLRYLAPVWDDFEAHAQLAPGQQWSSFLEALDSRGRGRIEVNCTVPGADGDAATLSARFVAKRRAT